MKKNLHILEILKQISKVILGTHLYFKEGKCFRSYPTNMFFNINTQYQYQNIYQVLESNIILITYWKNNP